jgi:hypothetical protein
MNIDRDTYEAWLLDRLEGRLTAEQERALDAFLAANPDLPVALGELPSIDAGAASFGDLASLKRTYPPQGLPDAARINDFLIARGEGDLTAEQLKALERFLFEHPEQERAARLVAAARIAPADVSLPAKAKLEKHFPPVGMPDRERISDFLIAAAEGDLDVAQRKALSGLIATDATLQREERLVKAARITNDAVVFAAKDKLKKPGGRVVPLWSFGAPLVRYAAAACLLLLLGMAWWTLRDGGAVKLETAQEVNPQPAPVTPQEGTAPKGTNVMEEDKPEAVMPGSKAPAIAPTPRRSSGSTPHSPAPAPLPTPAPEEPTLAQRPVPQTPEPAEAVLPEASVPVEAPRQLAAAPPARAAGTPARTVGELFTAGVRERMLDEPAANDRPLNGSDAVAFADKGLKGLTGGAGGVQVQRTAKRNRFKIRLGEGLAFSGSIGR